MGRGMTRSDWLTASVVYSVRQVAVELWDTVRCVTRVEVRSEVGRFSDAVRSAMITQAKRFLETR